MAEPDALPISVLVLDDHALFRESVARLLSAEEGFDVSHCGSISEALDLLGRRRVDVVLLDLDLGGENGVDFLPLARQQGFQGQVLVVAAAVERADAVSLIRQDVSGIVSKHDSALKLAEAIREVLAGKTRLDDRVLQTLAGWDGGMAQEHIAPFTARERTVLGYVFDGLTNKEIADRVGVSESAVKARLQQLFGKTGVRTRSQLVRIVLERYRNDF
ncbi:MAG TPA: response regulator transcription factor [Vicinamibacterales bacterium]|jgi:two-component system nitrate/nitrite response regulator NarL